jgi:phosphate starvation-inducible PhoH-like protein
MSELTILNHPLSIFINNIYITIDIIRGISFKRVFDGLTSQLFIVIFRVVKMLRQKQRPEFPTSGISLKELGFVRLILFYLCCLKVIRVAEVFFVKVNDLGVRTLAHRDPLIDNSIEEQIEVVEIPIEEGVLRPLLGPGDENLRYLQKHLTSKVTARKEKILVRGFPPENADAIEVITELIGVTRRKGMLSIGDIDTVFRLSGTIEREPVVEPTQYTAMFRSADRVYAPRSQGQERYLNAIREHDITFGIGPAGTGKTFIAVAVAVSQFVAGIYDRIVLVRPVVEAGENLGFLPGDVREKVDPYFRPLYDSLMKMIPADRLRKLLDRSVIEVAPLAYMRGRTLDNAFLILDEAQNTTAMQMKMFLTRMGERSKAVITGDLSQIDLPNKDGSGLMAVQDILKDVQGIKFVYLTASDVVRHPLVARIVTAYETHSKSESESNKKPIKNDAIAQTPSEDQPD